MKNIAAHWQIIFGVILFVSSLLFFVNNNEILHNILTFFILQNSPHCYFIVILLLFRCYSIVISLLLYAIFSHFVRQLTPLKLTFVNLHL